MEKHDRRVEELQWTIKVKRWDNNHLRWQMRAITAQRMLTIVEETSDRFDSRRYLTAATQEAALTLALGADDDYQALRRWSRLLERQLRVLIDELHQLRPGPFRTARSGSRPG